MKFIIIFSFWIAVVYSETGCLDMYRGESLYCNGLQLKSDEPVHLNTSFQVLEIYQATGSIGIETFSLMPQLVELTIRKSQISEIEDGALCSLPKLERLIIIDNVKFPVLTESLLTNCEKIKTFYVGGIQMESTVLKSMPELVTLKFDALELDRFTGEYLEPLNKLKSLEFFKCKLKQIEAGAICLSPELQTLVIMGNTILRPPTKSVFENCNSVGEFTYIYNNRFEVEEEVFSGFDKLKTAIIDNLTIEHLSEKYLTGLKTVELLQLDDSGISTVSANTFKDFVTLKILSLAGNNLNELDSDMFTDLTNLKKLDLSRNKITNIDNIKHTTLEVLKVSLNFISEINAEAVKSNLPNLKELEVSGNKMSREDEDLLGKKLEGIYVSGTIEYRD